MSDPTPEFGGKCAFGVSLGGPDRAPEGKAKYTVERNGKTYVLNGALPKFLFNLFPGLEARAQKKWAAAHKP